MSDYVDHMDEPAFSESVSYLLISFRLEDQQLGATYVLKERTEGTVVFMWRKVEKIV